MTPEHEALYRAALDADDAWQEELVMRYGKRAGDARYDDRGTSTARLDELWRAKRAADKALQIALQHYCDRHFQCDRHGQSS